MHSGHSVGQVAERFGLATSALRHWEELGLLEPDRDASGYRRYSDADVVRVAVIVHNREAGMSLDTIAVLLDADAGGRHDALQAHLDSIDAQVEALRRSRAMTEHAMRCRAHDIVACTRFREPLADVLEDLSA